MQVHAIVADSHAIVAQAGPLRANANAASESWGLLQYLLRSSQDMPSHDITLHDCNNS
jgi:hypothetical protein